ncbi:valacyclovir hydrolase [Diabrotica undecimpunctata]|uniref:valacyclovir hydrolase n=1 Tax=Diabrotica undecimpunctata TaxID=50387 RepID=UPI003B63FA89
MFLFKNTLKLTQKNLKLLAKMSSETLKTHKIDVDGQTINYLKVGNGPKTVLCFPGALGTIWSDFKPQLENLDRDKFTIVAWDPPGYGYSRPPNRNFGINFYRNDAICAEKLMNKLGINKYSLLGWSDGGISSMILSAKYPEKVEKLVCWGSNAYIVADEVKQCESLRDISKWSDKMKAPLIALYTEKGLLDMWNAWCDTFVKLYENGGDICKAELKQIKCPVFILHGDKDPMVAAEHPDYLLSNIKMAKLHRFPNGKHNIHLRYAEEFNSLVTKFLLE